MKMMEIMVLVYFSYVLVLGYTVASISLVLLSIDSVDEDEAIFHISANCNDQSNLIPDIKYTTIAPYSIVYNT